MTIQPPLDPRATQVDTLENAIELKEVEGLSQGQIVFRRFIHHKAAMVAAIVLGLVILLALSSIGFGPIPGWWQWDHVRKHDIALPGGHPTFVLSSHGISLGDFPFGQDDIGRDVFARVMRGTQRSLTVMVLIGVLATSIGLLLGSLAGYFRGRIDTLLMRFTDVIITIPLLVIGAVLGKLVGSGNAIALGIALGLFSWTTMARLVRGEFLSLREREFIDAARVAGSSDSRIIFKHMLPNAIGIIIVNTTLLMASAILLETALSYLGFGVNPPDVSLGQLINEYQSAFATRPWLFWWPGLFIVIIALCVNFIGDGLRDAFDPRQRKMPSKRSLRKD
jgi:ABC-type dipeptide/oligopeptide/nickel transport system permease subunit